MPCIYSDHEGKCDVRFSGLVPFEVELEGECNCEEDANPGESCSHFECTTCGESECYCNNTM